MWLWKYICHYQIQIAISASKREYSTQFRKGRKLHSSSSIHCVRKSFLNINISYHLKSSGMCACQGVGNVRFFRKFCARTKRSQVNNEKKMTKNNEKRKPRKPARLLVSLWLYWLWITSKQYLITIVSQGFTLSLLLFNIYTWDLFYDIDNLDLASCANVKTPYTFSPELNTAMRRFKD